MLINHAHTANTSNTFLMSEHGFLAVILANIYVSIEGKCCVIIMKEFHIYSQNLLEKYH